ncbi:MAG: hypothetical protein ABFE08_18925 [Armatimonadia bacterium]
MKIGFAEQAITPPIGTQVVGHFNELRFESVRDPLFARAMCLDNEKTFIFITCDLLSLRRSTVLEIRDRLHAATGVPAECICVSTTHTHTGPITTRMFGSDPDPAYVASLVDNISKAGLAAFESRQTGTLTAVWGFEGKLGHQRRFIMRDGRALMHPPKGGKDILYQEGPTDPEFAALWAEDEAGKPLGCWVNFSAHPNTMGGGTAVSADYPGFLATAMKQHQGEGFVTLYGNGCCGNLCAIDVYDPKRQDRGPEWAKIMGERLAQDVLDALSEGERMTDPLLDHRFAVVPMPIRHVPDELIEWARAIQAAPEADNSYMERCYAGMVLELMELQRREPTAPSEISAFRIGDFAIATLPGEIFVEFGLDIKLKSPARRTWLVELANGVVGYVPTKRAFEGGGYEQRTCTSSKLDPVAGEMMVATARALLESMFR